MDDGWLAGWDWWMNGCIDAWMGWVDEGWMDDGEKMGARNRKTRKILEEGDNEMKRRIKRTRNIRVCRSVEERTQNYPTSELNGIHVLSFLT